MNSKLVTYTHSSDLRFTPKHIGVAVQGRKRDSEAMTLQNWWTYRGDLGRRNGCSEEVRRQGRIKKKLGVWVDDLVECMQKKHEVNSLKFQCGILC